MSSLYPIHSTLHPRGETPFSENSSYLPNFKTQLQEKMVHETFSENFSTDSDTLILNQKSQKATHCCPGVNKSKVVRGKFFEQQPAVGRWRISSLKELICLHSGKKWFSYGKENGEACFFF